MNARPKGLHTWIQGEKGEIKKVCWIPADRGFNSGGDENKRSDSYKRYERTVLIPENEPIAGFHRTSKHTRSQIRTGTGRELKIGEVSVDVPGIEIGFHKCEKNFGEKHGPP